MLISKSNRPLGVPTLRCFVMTALEDRPGCAYTRCQVFKNSTTHRLVHRGPNKPCRLSYVFMSVACLDVVVLLLPSYVVAKHAVVLVGRDPNKPCRLTYISAMALCVAFLVRPTP